MQQMIRADGGSGDYIETTPPMLGIWNTLLEGAADATWVSVCEPIMRHNSVLFGGVMSVRENVTARLLARAVLAYS